MSQSSGQNFNKLKRSIAKTLLKWVPFPSRLQWFMTSSAGVLQSVCLKFRECIMLEFSNQSTPAQNIMFLALALLFYFCQSWFTCSASLSCPRAYRCVARVVLFHPKLLLECSPIPPLLHAPCHRTTLMRGWTVTRVLFSHFRGGN